LEGLRYETTHLPADLLGLGPTARRALSEGIDFRFLPTVSRVEDINLPAERHDEGERGLLADALSQRLDPLNPHAAVRRNIALLGELGTFAVVTGQQPGLLTSPLYCLYKALQAVHLACDLTDRLGAPVVPLFWNHADDHDVAEVHHAWQLNHNLDLQKVALASMSSGRTPIGELHLDEERHRLGALHANLRQLYGDRPHIDEVLELFVPRHGETLATAFTRTFTELLGPRGLIVLEPEWLRPELSRALAYVVGREPIDALATSAAELEAAELPVPIDPGTAALLYRHRDGAREPLRARGGCFVYPKEEGSRTGVELAAEIVSTPSSWSAGALLRPLVQDQVLPVVAYVGGLGELAYHAQLRALREACDLPLTPFVPRVSCTLVDRATRASLEKLGIDARRVLEDRGQFDVEPEEGPPVLGELRDIARRCASELLGQREALSSLDRGLAMNLKRAADQVTDVVEKIATKADRVHANQSGKGKRHVRRVNHGLFPREEPQERVLGPLDLCATHGPEVFVSALAAELPSVCSEHLVLQETEGATQGDSA